MLDLLIEAGAKIDMYDKFGINVLSMSQCPELSAELALRAHKSYMSGIVTKLARNKKKKNKNKKRVKNTFSNEEDL